MTASLLALEAVSVDRGRDRVLDGISLTIGPGEFLGLVGRSGSGKSTLARAALRLIEPEQGAVRFRGRDLLDLSARELRLARREMQIVFQEPTTSLDPRMTVAESLAEPFGVHRLAPRRELAKHVVELLRRVELGPELLQRYPHEISGGQAQRIALARALATSPSLLVADEPLSALDVSLRAQMVNLLSGLRTSLGIACLFVTHDLALAAVLCDRIAVLASGRLVEIGPAMELLRSPRHPETRALVDAAIGSSSLPV